MDNLPFYKTQEELIFALKSLHSVRKASKISPKRLILSKKERKEILKKTDCRCHVCGITLSDKFQADHVKCHSSGGDHDVNNFLPSCDLCNNYRWHYSPHEIQWILKLGVWARGQILKETVLGKNLASSFINHEQKRENRRKVARSRI